MASICFNHDVFELVGCFHRGLCNNYYSGAVHFHAWLGDCERIFLIEVMKTWQSAAQMRSVTNPRRFGATWKHEEICPIVGPSLKKTFEVILFLRLIITSRRFLSKKQKNRNTKINTF